MSMEEKQGQEEIVGFVVVVVLVAVIALVVLGFVLRPGLQQESVESVDIAYFLESVFAMTSECTLRGQHQASVGEVASACATDSKRRCGEGAEACGVLNRTLAKTIAAAWDVSNIENFTASTASSMKFSNGQLPKILNTSNAIVHASAVQGYVLNLTHRLSSTNERVLLTQQQGACKEGWYNGEHLQPVQGRRGTLIASLKLCFA